MHLRAWVFVFSLLTIGFGTAACSGRQDTALPALPQGNVSLGLPGTPDSTSTPIKHIVVVIQENRSFDDLFATFPGANGTTTGLAEPMSQSEQTYCAEKGQPVITKETSIPLTQVNLLGKGFPNNFNWWQDLSHDYPHGYLGDCDAGGTGSNSQPSASNPCAMDGFDLSWTGANGSGHPTCTYTYQYVNPSKIRPYWNMAQQYVLADNAFQTQGSLSFTAHQALIAGGTAINSYESIIDDPTFWPWGCDAPPGVHTSLITTSGKYLSGKGPLPCLTYGTVRDGLDAAKIPWKYYTVQIEGGNSGIWDAFDAIKAVRYSKEWGNKVAWPDTKIFGDIRQGTLPAVSWITPDAVNSDHPAVHSQQGVNEDLGPSWVASIVNAVGQSKFWNSTAIVVLWDDWGGYYDHVAPPLYDNQGGLGFRFPMIIISPYVQAHVEHTQYETASIVKFIEKNWGLPLLGQEDQRAASIGNAFDFNQKPRAFKKIPSQQSPSYFLHQAPSGLPPDTE
ncbi:MAG TPA: alkaline phosphatase family protein [Candidatus Cybelea sp.]